MVTADTTRVGADVVAAITPAATRSSVQACVNTPTVVVQPRIAPPPVMIYASRNSNLWHKSSKPRQVRPMAVHVKGKPHPRKRPPVKVIATPTPHKTAVIMPSSTPVPATPPLIVTPVVVASVTETPMPVEGTVVSSMPDIVIINVTPDTSMTSTNPFTNSLRKKGAMRIPVPPAPKSTRKNTVKNNNRVREEVECSRSTTYKADSEGTMMKAKRHAGLLLGSSLLGTLLFCCFVFARRREE